jgi:haloacetate dehalogenase
VLDVLPTAAAWELADARFALGYWPWSLLAQPEPLPERLLAAAPEAVVDDALSGWGSPAGAFGSEVRAAYVDALRDPARVHAICEEYRAAATLDRKHDEADRTSGRRIECPVLVLWSGRGALGSWYEEVGGPLAIWRQWSLDAARRSTRVTSFPGKCPASVRQRWKGSFPTHEPNLGLCACELRAARALML